MPKRETVEELKHRISKLEKEAKKLRSIEKKLLKEQALLEQLFETSEAAIVMADRDIKPVRTNSAFSQMFGYTEKEAVGKHLNTLITPKEFQDEAVMHRKKLIKREIGCYDAVRMRKDGSLIDVSVILSQIIINNKQIGYYALYRDIAERKQAEKALKKAHDELEQRVEERTAELLKANSLLKQEIKERKQVEKKLHEKTRSLKELNTALKVLLEKREDDKRDFEEKVLSNIFKLVEPYIERLRKTRLNKRQQSYLDVLKTNLDNIISSFPSLYSYNMSALTHTEMEVANLIKQGRSTKEIAEISDLSKKTIEYYRNNIRKKLGLKNKKRNLRSHLLSLH